MNVVCASRISQVTVHARGALVTRSVTVPRDLPDGGVSIEVRDVTLLAEAGSMRASLAGGARAVVGVRSALLVPDTPAVPGESVELVRTLSGKVERLRAERERLGAHRADLLTHELEPRLRRARGEDGGGVVARAADALAMTEMVAEALQDLDRRLLEIDESLLDLDDELEAARLADAQAQSRARMGAGHPTRRVTIELHGDGPVGGAELTYAVPAARWWPVYTLRLTDAGRRASWWLEALVAQRSGESWDGVALSLSTADLIHDARLPELPSLRLGRRQERARPAYRPPPAGLERMFAGHDRAFGTRRREVAAVTDQVSIVVDEIDEEPTRPGFAADMDMAAQAAPPQQQQTTRMASLPLRAPAAPAAARGFAGGTMGSAVPAPPPPPPPEPAALEPSDAWLDHDGLVMAGTGDERRGRLVPATQGAAAGRGQAAAAQQLESLPAPPGTRDPLETRGRFDHRHDAAGTADVPSDGLEHRVALAVAEATPELRWRAVPREAPEVFKEAALVNPFAAPLLAGPVDVYLEGTLLATTVIEKIDRGGRLTVGMGVEDRIRIARNARAEESAAGLMRGSTLVETEVTIELASSLGSDAVVEVIDRIPVSDDRALEVELRGDAARYDQSERGAPIRGGLRWAVKLPAGGKAQVGYRYAITFPARSEIIGGNRRD